MGNVIFLILTIVFSIAAISMYIYKHKPVRFNKSIKLTGEDEMEILKEKVNEEMNKLNQEWVTALKRGETEGGLDLGDMFAKYSAIISNIDKEFQAAKDRRGKK